MRRIAPFLPAALYYVLITLLSDRPILPLPQLFPLQDKLVHFVIFLGFGFCLLYGRARIKPESGLRPQPGALALLAVLGAAAGGLDELHQSFVPGRTADWADLAADILGVAAAGLIVPLLVRRPWGRRLFGPRAS